MEFTLECQTRPADSKPRALRRSGLIPAVLYGHQGTESVALTVNAKDLADLLKNPASSNSVINLKVADGWSGKTVIKEIQTHPWKGHPYHLSFWATPANGND